MRKKILSYLVLTVFVIYLVDYIHNHSGDFRALLHVSPIYIVIIAGLHLFAIFLNGLFIKYTLIPFKKTIASGEAFFVSLIATMGNYFLPVGAGTGMKAVYLKKKFQLAYADFLATLSGNYIVVFLINSFFGLVGLVMLRHLAPRSEFGVLLLVLGGVFLSMLILAAYGFPKILIKWLSGLQLFKKLAGAIAQVLRGWNIITNNKDLLLRLVVITLINFFTSMVMFHTIANSLKLSISFWALLLYTSLGALSFLLNITPGSIGIREAIFIFSSATLGITTPQILSISIVQNGVLFLVFTLSWLLLQIPYLKQKLVPVEARL